MQGKGILFLSLLSMNVFADLNGKWSGQGEWKFQGSGDHCFIQMSFEDSRDSLIRNGGYLDCSVVGQEIPGEQFFKFGNILKNKKGEIVGNYTDNLVRISEIYSDNVKIETVINLKDQHFDYSEKWMKMNGEEIYDINGRLFLEGN